MEEIVLKGKEYGKLCNLKRVDKKAIFYTKNSDVLVYERIDDKKRLHLPSIITTDEDSFYTFLNHSVGISLENIECFLRLVDYYPKFETINSKLKKNYIKRLRDYYSCYVDSNLSKEFSPIEYFDTMIYPIVIPIEEAIEKCFSYKEKSHTGYALCEFQKIKKR